MTPDNFRTLRDIRALFSRVCRVSDPQEKLQSVRKKRNISHYVFLPESQTTIEREAESRKLFDDKSILEMRQRVFIHDVSRVLY